MWEEDLAPVSVNASTPRPLAQSAREEEEGEEEAPAGTSAIPTPLPPPLSGPPKESMQMALFATEVLLPFAITLCLFPSANADCVWDRDEDFSEFPPLLMNKGTWTSILPSLNGAIREVRISPGTTVVIACPESIIQATGTEVAEAVCEWGNVLNVNGMDYDMIDLGCYSLPKESVMKNIGPCGADGSGARSVIGFDVVGYEFYDLIEVCFDPKLETTLYTYHLLRGAHAAANDGNPSRPGFKSDRFFSVSANTCYSTSSQVTMLNRSLERSDVIDYREGLYMARGHLSPDADFMTELERDATYYYINAAPQWHVFNNGNWKTLERSVRDLAEEHGTDFQVWTGASDILELDDANNNPVEIYLGLFEREDVIPAPNVMWKVIYEPSTNRGVAVIGVNNPFLASFPSEICPIICGHHVPWLDFDDSNLEKGPSYICSVQDLHDAVPNAPDLGEVELLSH